MVDSELMVTTVYADYSYYFSLDSWDIEDVPFLLLGFNPEVMKGIQEDPVTQEYMLGVISDELLGWSIEFGLWENVLERLQEYLKTSINSGNFYKSNLYKSNLRVEGFKVKPLDILNWFYCLGCSFHPHLKKHLKSIKHNCRFPNNSDLLNDIEHYGKKDIWTFKKAVKLLLSSSIGEVSEFLYYNKDPNYIAFKLHEISTVLDNAFQSWRVGSLEIFNNEENYDLDYVSSNWKYCEVEAKVFIKWAILKGYTPPEQLLEAMGLDVDRGVGVGVDIFSSCEYTTPYLDLMRKAIVEFKISDKNQGTVEALSSWFQNENDVGVSGRLAKAMATLIRHKDSQKGKGKN